MKNPKFFFFPLKRALKILGRHKTKSALFAAGLFLAAGFFLFNWKVFFGGGPPPPPPPPPPPQQAAASLLARSPCRGQAAAARLPQKAPPPGRLKSPAEAKSSPGGPARRRALLKRLTEEPLDWIIKDINGEVIDFYCYRGKARLLVNLWATWCPPCIEELPSLSRLARKTAGSLLIAAVSTEPEGEVRRFIQRSFPHLSHHLKIAVLPAEQLKAYFPEDRLPVTYLFSGDGRLERKFAGPKKWDDPNLTRQMQLPL